jgi:hypothetical protein
MTPEKDKELCDRYPKIFNRVTGTEHSDGWFDIIDCLCSTIQQHVNWKRKTGLNARMSDEEFDEIHQVRVAQVKEKWGGLRFYVDGADDYVRGAIDLAESMSFRTCEVCGNKGQRRSGGWIRTLCDGCVK